jgi:cysteine desulfurase family protein
MIYLNNSATSYPKPVEVIDSVTEFLKNPPTNHSRSGIEKSGANYVELCREALAELFNISDPNRIAFTSGSTEALNIAINGLELNDAKVITTVTEHNSVLRPLRRLESQGRIEIQFIVCDELGRVHAQDIIDAIDDKTRLIVVNHCSNVSGSIIDVKTICEAAKARGVLVLADASQSAGSIDIDCSDWQVDMLAFTGHKCLYGMQGIGGLYVRDGLDLSPLKVGGTGINSALPYHPLEMPTRLEAGTPNMPGIVALNAGVRYVLKYSVKSLRRARKKLIERLRTALSEIDGVKFYSPWEGSSKSLLSFTLEGSSPEEIAYFLESSLDISVRAGLHCAPLIAESWGLMESGTLRVSPSPFNSESDIDLFVQAIKDFKALQD